MMSAAGIVFPQKSGFDRLAFRLDLSGLQTSAKQGSQSLLDCEVRQARGDDGSGRRWKWKAAGRHQLRSELLAGIDGDGLKHVWTCCGTGAGSASCPTSIARRAGAERPRWRRTHIRARWVERSKPGPV